MLLSGCIFRLSYTECLLRKCRLVYHCLLELCRCKCKGIVQDAIMLGTPVDVIPVCLNNLRPPLNKLAHASEDKSVML